jgi:hypothetical protein
MARISPTIEGFRASCRRPSLTLAEIAWRWTVGATAWALLGFGVIEYLNTLPVTNAELLLLRTRHPFLVGQAIAHILRGSLSRALMAGLLATLALAFLWIFAASVGRMATVRALLDFFSNRLVSDASASEPKVEKSENRSPNVVRSFRSLIGLNFLRVAVALAAVAGFQGAAILAGFASPEADPQPGLAFLLFLPLAALTWLAWWVLNWLLSLAAIFGVRDSENTLGALSAAVTLCRERSGAVFAVTTWTVLAHVAAFVGATAFVSVPLAFLPAVPGRLVLAAVLLVTLAYFAGADWLYMVRLAGYVCIAEMPEMLPLPAPLPPTPLPTPPPVQSTIDRDELILSDMQLATEP